MQHALKDGVVVMAVDAHGASPRSGSDALSRYDDRAPVVPAAPVVPVAPVLPVLPVLPVALARYVAER